MKTDRNRRRPYTLFAVTALLAPFLGWSQNPFPEAEMRETVLLVCSQCHPLTRITEGDLTAEEWEFTLYDMIARGAPIHEEDIAFVREYLIDNFATDR